MSVTFSRDGTRLGITVEGLPVELRSADLEHGLRLALDSTIEKLVVRYWQETPHTFESRLAMGSCVKCGRMSDRQPHSEQLKGGIP